MNYDLLMSIALWLNVVLALGTFTTNFIYFLVVKVFWRWLKLFYAINSLLVLYIYFDILTTPPSDPLMVRLATTLLYTSLFSGSLYTFLCIAPHIKIKKKYKIVPILYLENGKDLCQYLIFPK